MTDIWTVIGNFIDAISAFIDWFMNDTPLFYDTLDGIYEWGVQTYNILYPLIGEYIYYLSQYSPGVVI